MIKKLTKYLVDLSISIESYFIKPEKTERKKILILRKDGLGDYLIFYPTLKYYRELYLEYEITIVISTIAKDLINKMPWIDNFILFDKKEFGSNFFYRRNFLLNLKRKNFEIAFYPVVTREPMGDFMISITNAIEKIGFKTISERNDIYTKLIDLPVEIKSEIEADKYFINALGGKLEKIQFPTIELTEKEILSADEILMKNNLQNKETCIIFPGSNFRFKIWPLNKYAEIIDFLIEKNIVPVVCGSNNEKVLAEGIRQFLKKDSYFIDLIGKTENVFTLAGLLKKSKLYIGSDTGIAHLSAAILTPTICLIGGGHFGRFFPYGNLEKNKIVYDHDMKCMNDNWKCVENILGSEPAPCIKNIKVEVVKKEIDNLLKNYDNR